MHYIRFLKAPTLNRWKTSIRLHAKVTITTDLGDSFLCIDLPILVTLIDQTGNNIQVHSYQWKAGKRELEISFSFPPAAISSGLQLIWPCRLLVEPQDTCYRLAALADMLLPSSQGDRLGLVLPVLSEELIAEAVFSGEPIMRSLSDMDDPSSSPFTRVTPKRVARHIQMAGGDEFYVWEETGESIARHIWDAGLLLSAYLDKSSASIEDSAFKHPECLKSLLSKDKLKVLELGTGCGIVGMTMAKRFSKAEVLITDLLEAEEIAKHNISMIAEQSRPDGSFLKLSYQNLDWEKHLPESIRDRNMDLVLVADCTYNSDVVPDLVKTLADLVNCNQEVLILVAMKIRHYSEVVFFDLMKKKNMLGVGKLVFPLPVLGQDSEEIEFHFFKGD